MPTVKTFKIETNNHSHKKGKETPFHLSISCDCATTHDLKWYLFRFLPTFIILWLFCTVQKQIFKFVNLSLFLRHVSIFWLEHLYVLPKCRGPALKLHVRWCKTGIYSWNLSKKVCLCYTEIHFQFQFLAMWSISVSILFIIVWKAPARIRSPSGLAVFLKIDLQCFGPFGKFQDTKEISMCFQIIFAFLVTMVISSLYVLNYFKCSGKTCFKKSKVFIRWIVLSIFGQNVWHNQTRKLYQVFMYNFLSKWLDIHKDFRTISSLCSKMFQCYHIIYIKSITP